jgi:hypothetical protein
LKNENVEWQPLHSRTSLSSCQPSPRSSIIFCERQQQSVK